MKKQKILIFGASIVHGSHDAEGGGWADRLKAFGHAVSAKNNFQTRVVVFNLGIGGNTTNDLLKRFTFETEQRTSPQDEPYFVFSIGTNDAAFLIEKKAFLVTREQYGKNIRQIIKEAKAFSNNIIFLTPPPVIDEITSDGSLTGKTRANSDIKMYGEDLKQICDEEKVATIDVYSEFMKLENYKELFMDDGLHPNTKGHALIFEIVKKYFNGFE